MGIDIEKLKGLAEAATKGIWCTDGARQVMAAESDQLNSGFVIVDCQGPDNLRNAQFIAAANPAAVLELIEEVEFESLSHWRDLTLKFDNHRMAALWHLKALLQSQEHAGAAHAFLEAPPMAAHEILVERDQLKAENEDGLAVIRTLKEQLNCYMKDAERYRILRNERFRPGRLSSNPEMAKYLDEYMICGDKMDAVIDAEIAKEAI